MWGAIHVLPGNDLDLAVVPLLALGDVQVPHTVIDQLVPAPLYQGTCQPITIFHHLSFIFFRKTDLIKYEVIVRTIIKQMAGMFLGGKTRLDTS